MAYGDFTKLLPGEAYQSGPRGGLDAATAEARQKASYLSSMDQFYAQLDEMERQFDITSKLAQDQFEWQTGEAFDWEKEQFERQEDIQIKEIQSRSAIAGIQARGQEEVAKYGYELGMAELGFKERESENTMSFLQDYFSKMGSEGEGIKSGFSYGVPVPGTEKETEETSVLKDYYGFY